MRLRLYSRLTPPADEVVAEEDYPVILVVEETITAKWSGDGEQVATTFTLAHSVALSKKEMKRKIHVRSIHRLLAISTDMLLVEIRLRLMLQVISKRYGSWRHTEDIGVLDSAIAAMDLLDPFFCPNGMWVRSIPIIATKPTVIASMGFSRPYQAYSGRGVALQTPSILDKHFYAADMALIRPLASAHRGREWRSIIQGMMLHRAISP